MNPHPLTKKRELGAFYTPPELSRVLTDWAIRRPGEAILEPSFGGCGFFDSSIERLNLLGCEFPERQLYGVDIDQHAFDILSKKFERVVDVKNRFIKNDFIAVELRDFKIDGFDVVIGNPPYVSMHNMTIEQRASCEKILKESPFSGSTMGRNASLWAFFLIHSLAFLLNEGRVAWVLPSSLLHSDYAKKLLEIHKKVFRKIKLIKLAERFFEEEGTKESSIILLAEGFTKNGSENCELSIKSVDDLSMLKKVIYAQHDMDNCHIENYKYDFVSKKALQIYLKLTGSQESAPLSFYADIKIGMVTGANNFFIVNQKTVEEHSIEQHTLKPVIGRFSNLKGLTHTKLRQENIQSSGERAWLVCPSIEDMNSNTFVSRYLSQISTEEKDQNRTFKKRPYWFAPGHGIDGIIPDAFLSYMIHLSPRMVVNQAKINCTNSVHKVLFHDRNCSFKLKLAISLSLLSTYSQLSAEFEGRAYSSGVLKVEPSSAKRIELLLTENIVDELVESKREVEKALMKGNHKDATRIIDSIFIRNKIFSHDELVELCDAVRHLRNERYKRVKKLNE